MTAVPLPLPLTEFEAQCRVCCESVCGYGSHSTYSDTALGIQDATARRVTHYFSLLCSLITRQFTFKMAKNKGQKRALAAQEGASKREKVEAKAAEVAMEEKEEETKDITPFGLAAKKVAYINKQRVLVFASRGITARYRHLLEDIRAMLPHHKRDAKVSSLLGGMLIRSLEPLA